MQYAFDEKAEKLIYQRLREHFEKNNREYVSKTFHVSDLLTPRQAFFKYTDPKPLTTREIGFFTAGLAHHFVIETAIAKDDQYSEEPVTLKSKDGLTVIGRPDVKTMVFYKGEPNEIKTSRKWSIPEEPDENYIKQLRAYCAMLNNPVGRLTVFYINPGRRWDGKTATEPDMKVWKITFNPLELKKERLALLAAARLLESAVRTKKHTALPLCTSWMCGSKGKTKKDEPKISCKWYAECKPEGRFPASNLE